MTNISIICDSDKRGTKRGIDGGGDKILFIRRIIVMYNRIRLKYDIWDKWGK